MVEPKEFKEDMESKVKPCGNCEPFIITVEDILAASIKSEISGEEAIAPLFKGTIPEKHCCSDGGSPCCCGEE